jgi:hypothetical protein
MQTMQIRKLQVPNLSSGWQHRKLTNEPWTASMSEKGIEGKKDHQKSKRLKRFSLLTAWMVLKQWRMSFKRTQCIKISYRHWRTFTTEIGWKKKARQIYYSIAAFKITWLALNDGLFRAEQRLMPLHQSPQ